MNEVDLYLDQACRQVSGPATLRKHLRKELKEHLEEATRTLVTEGMSREEATTAAIESLGEPETIRDGMQSVYGHNSYAQLVTLPHVTEDVIESRVSCLSLFRNIACDKMLLQFWRIARR